MMNSKPKTFPSRGSREGMEQGFLNAGKDNGVHLSSVSPSANGTTEYAFDI